MAEIFNFNVQDNRSIQFPRANLLEPIMQEDHNVAVWRFRIPKVLNDIDMSAWAWWFVYVNAKGQKFTELLTLVDDIDEPDEYCTADYNIDYRVSYNPGSFQFSLEAINADSGGEILNEWHTKTYSHKVDKTLQGNQAQWAETESDIISALIIEVQNRVSQLVGGATPEPVSLIADMTDTSKVYLYVGTETGYTAGNWYYYNGSAWTSGGVYASGITIDSIPTQGSNNAVSSGGVWDALRDTDDTLTQAGQAADAKAVGDAINNITIDVDTTLTQQGEAADAKTVGDSIRKLDGDINTIVDGVIAINGIYNINPSDFEAGNIAYSSGNIVYNNSTKRVRTKQGIKYHLTSGFKVSLSTYDGYRLYVGGSTTGSGWVSADYTINSEDDYFILIRKEPEVDLANISELVSLLSITYPDNEITKIKNVLGAVQLGGWVYGKYINTAGTTVDLTSPTTSSSYRYLATSCAAGDSFVINAQSATANARPWCFVDSEGNVLKVASSYRLTSTNQVITAPTNATKLIVNDKSLTGICYKGYINTVFTEKTKEFNALIGKDIDFEIGQYYWAGGNTVGTSAENVSMAASSTRMCCLIALPAGKILRVVGRLDTDTSSTRVYRVYNASTGILQAVSDATTNVVSTYLRFDFDARVYINTLIDEDYYIGILSAETAYYDIYQYNVKPQESIIELNQNAPYAIKTMRRPERSQTRPFILCHFSDIHADAVNLARITDFMTAMTGLIDAKICTGDMVASTLDDGMDWWDTVSGTGDIMLTMGNHECAAGTGGSVTYDGATSKAVYDEVLADRISVWGVTQPTDAATNGLCYYYKDFSTWKLRLIVLDINHDATYKSAQLTWLESVLASAKTSGYAVCIADHYQFGANSGATKMDCSFNPGHAIKSETNSWYIPSDYEQAVDDFIDAGGEFVCWLTGHGHQDYVLINQSGKQMSVAVTTANFANSNAWSFGDDYREKGTKSQDAFNIVGIDTYSKNISVYRIGNDLSRLMQPRHRLCLDYANRKVIWSD